MCNFSILAHCFSSATVGEGGKRERSVDELVPPAARTSLQTGREVTHILWSTNNFTTHCCSTSLLLESGRYLVNCLQMPKLQFGVRYPNLCGFPLCCYSAGGSQKECTRSSTIKLLNNFTQQPLMNEERRTDNGWENRRGGIPSCRCINLAASFVILP